MTWFERLVGFREESPDQVRGNLTLAGSELTSRVNGRVMKCGTLEIPTLAELRRRAADVNGLDGRLTFRQIVADVGSLHRDPDNAGAMFQVASQFNLLEMTGPNVSPEKGVGIYEHDPTQGPACAIAAGAGTIYRNYFVPVGDQIGQTASRQIDCLQDIGSLLGNDDGRLWTMRNGYAVATSENGLKEIGDSIRSAGEAELDSIRTKLRIGLQTGVEVTSAGHGHTVSQAFCSAIPLGYYSDFPAELWEPFARLILEATYEATICASVINAAATGNRTVFLTLVGGGVFGNDIAWITEAIDRAVTKYANNGLDVALVSYSSPKPEIANLIAKHS